MDRIGHGLEDNAQIELQTPVLNIPDVIAHTAPHLPELSRLADDPTYFSRQSTMITDARTLLSGTALDKIAIIARIASDRPQALTLIAAALEIVRFSMRNQPSRELLDTSKHLVDLYDAVQANANIRLQFTNFVIQ